MAASKTNISNSNVQLPSLKLTANATWKSMIGFLQGFPALSGFGAGMGIPYTYQPTTDPKRKKSDIGCFQKNTGKTTKIDGENNGKPMENPIF